MSTINDPDVVLEMLKRKGRYSDDPPVAEIILYLNPFDYWSVKVGYHGAYASDMLTAEGVDWIPVWNFRDGRHPYYYEPLLDYLKRGGLLPIERDAEGLLPPGF